MAVKHHLDFGRALDKKHPGDYVVFHVVICADRLAATLNKSLKRSAVSETKALTPICRLGFFHLEATLCPRMSPRPCVLRPSLFAVV